MSQNNYNQSQQEFQEFREKLYQSLNYRRDTVMDLVDALAANTTARSPVELSLSPLFEREYSALYKGIQEMSRTTQTDSTEAEKSRKFPTQARMEAIAELIPTPKQKQFYLWAIDVTPLPRPWERYLPQKTAGFLTPSQVQRDMNRIITEMGTPANSPKRRGFSGGRTQGMIQTKRTRHEVIKKAKKEKKPEPSPPIAV